MRRWSYVLICVLVGVALGGCPKNNGHADYKAGEKAFDLKDYDAAVDYYSKALDGDPHNAFYRIKLNDARFEAGQLHVHQGVKLRDKGDLQGAVAEFQRAQVLDPSSVVADQELKKTLDMMADKVRATEQQSAAPLMDNGEPALASEPPELKPLSRAPISLKMSNDAKIVFDTIGKLAGLTVIYDPDLQARRITADLNNVTLEQALDIVSLESKAFWKPITENIIMVIPDQTQKRRDYEEQVVRTFYLSNVAVPQDLTEITTGLRQLLDLKRIQQVNAQNAIIVRDTPDKLALIEKIIRDIDKAKPEVILQVEILQASTDHMRNLGILPPQSTTVAINPNNSTTNSITNGTNTVSSFVDHGNSVEPVDTFESERRGADDSERDRQFFVDRLVDKDRAKPGDSVGGWPAGETAHWQPRAGGNGKLSGRRGSWHGGGQSAGQHAIPVHRRRCERGRDAARSSESRCEHEAGYRSVVGNGAGDDRRNSAANYQPAQDHARNSIERRRGQRIGRLDRTH